MIRHRILAAALLAAGAAQAAHQGMPAEQGLGTSAALDAQGRLWIARTEAAPENPQLAYVVLQMSTDLGQHWSAPRRVQAVPEAVEANGESRPKLVFGPQGEFFVTYTHPLGKPYTGEIRFARSTDGGAHFNAPVTLHRNRDLITHRFDSAVVDRQGRLFVAWIDKRDTEAARARKQPYAGAAVYYAVSDDGGASFRGDYKLADHSCECCRIALTPDEQGQPAALWRGVFGTNVRDHAFARLQADGAPTDSVRASFDEWHVDACPHHGPAMAFAADGTRHQVWFNVSGDTGGAFYASAAPDGSLGKPVRLGGDQAEHPDVAVQGQRVALVWKEFTGERTEVRARLSADQGKTWRAQTLSATAGKSDHPHLLATPDGILLVWRTVDDGVRVQSLFARGE